jgi:hypothetical protein
MNKELIIECAKSLGFRPPHKVRIQKWSQEKDMFPVTKWIDKVIRYSDIEVHRGVTINGNDLGEYWITYPQSINTSVK